MGPVSRFRTFLAAGVAALAAACVRGPADEICPSVAPGDLVITELRGPQSGGDTYGEWIEVYNATGAEVDLQGTVLDLRSIDGATAVRLLVRDPLPLPAGGYAALGTSSAGVVAYAFGADWDDDLPASGGVSLLACGAFIDRVVWRGLPESGTYSLGTTPPSADSNDLATAWCIDTTPGSDGTQLGLPGTPGAANHPCAP